MPNQRTLGELSKRKSTNRYIVAKIHGHGHADKYIGRFASKGAYFYLDGIIQNVYEYSNGVVTRSRVMSIPLTHYAYLAPSTWNDLTEEDESVQRSVDRLVEEDTANRVRQVQTYNRDFPGVGFPGLPDRVKDDLSLQTTSSASRISPDKLPGKFAELPGELTGMINKYRTGGTRRKRRSRRRKL